MQGWGAQLTSPVHGCWLPEEGGGWPAWTPGSTQHHRGPFSVCEPCRGQSMASQRDWADSSGMRENTALSSSVGSKRRSQVWRCLNSQCNNPLVTHFRPYNGTKNTLMPILNAVSFGHWLEKYFCFTILRWGYGIKHNNVYNYRTDTKRNLSFLKISLQVCKATDHFPVHCNDVASAGAVTQRGHVAVGGPAGWAALRPTWHHRVWHPIGNEAWLGNVPVHQDAGGSIGWWASWDLCRHRIKFSMMHSNHSWARDFYHFHSVIPSTILA